MKEMPSAPPGWTTFRPQIPPCALIICQNTLRSLAPMLNAGPKVSAAWAHSWTVVLVIPIVLSLGPKSAAAGGCGALGGLRDAAAPVGAWPAPLPWGGPATGPAVPAQGNVQGRAPLTRSA